MRKVWLLLLPIVFAPVVFSAVNAQTTATPYEKQIGVTPCTNAAASADFDTLAQCTSTDSTSGTFQKAPIFAGKVTSPPYAATTCDSNKAGMLQWTGTYFQGCDGTSWITFGPHIASFLVSDTTAAYDASDATKDAACSTDFGPAYMAAQALDVALYVKANLGIVATFNLATETTVGFRLRNHNSVVDVYGTVSYAGTYPVACIRKDAPALFSRTTVSAADSDVTKDAACSTDFGPGYMAANIVTAAGYVGATVSGRRFNARGYTRSIYIDGYDTTIRLMDITGGTYSVMCIRK